MSVIKDFTNGVGDVAKSGARDIGAAYQEILLQHSPLNGRRANLETTDPWPTGATAPVTQPSPGISGETLSPEAGFYRGPGEATSLDPASTIDADYEEIPETPQIEHRSDIDGPSIGG